MAKNNKDIQQRADLKRAGQRTRNWTIIFYPEDLPENWKDLVDELQVKWIESPVHDKDLNADKKLKKMHCHTLFMFNSVKTLEQIIEMLSTVFELSETGSIIGIALPQMVNDRCAIVRYMAHLDNPDKAQYDIAKIIGHNGADVSEILKFSATEVRKMIIAMEEYIEENNIIELSEFSKKIRYNNPEWHTLLSTKMTIYFNAFIRSRRYSSEKNINKIFDEDGVLIEK